MRQFGMLALTAGVWVGAAHGQDVDSQASGAVVGGVATLGPPPPPPDPVEPTGPDLPVAVGVSAGTATFLPGGGKPAGGAASTPSIPRGGRGGGQGSGGGGSSAAKSSGVPILPAQTPSVSKPDPTGPSPAEALPSVGGPNVQDAGPPFFPPPPPPPPLGAPLPPGGDPVPPGPPPPDGGTDSDPGSPPGPIVEGPEPGTLVLAGIGVIGAIGWRRRRR
ncbi:MAG TPA: PEP-CTERM sorting domain-containing protein [Fimbriiglobus sp.]|nr:PEP-CTERM sorting domain-containing protein [Fimbriiglobus sp.]